MLIVFSLARALHTFWRSRLRDFLDGRGPLTLEQAVGPHDCDLGKWLDAVGMPKYGRIPTMQTLGAVHEEMHAAVRGVLALQFSGDREAAEREYARVVRLSDQVVALLDELDGLMKAHARDGSEAA